jgi:hypothetical protein
MTERELSRKLAERFEPEPMSCTERGRFVGRGPSQGGWWVLRETEWEPRSYREPDRVVWMLKKLFIRIDTPNMLKTMGEDEWIRIQRNIWHSLNRKYDDGSNFENLYADALATALAGQQEE